MRPCTSTFPIDSSRNIRFRCTDASASVQGEVYRARDTKLGRDVAIKVLPEHFAADKDRMARFEREARVLASLNHPNIAAIYGLEEDDGYHYLVMELVPGESLAARLQRGPLSVAEVLSIARQLIDALEAAHENGIVHRDLKPANIQLTPEGQVKVLDFGLAKVETGEAPSAETSLSPTMPRDGTRAGIILGTASYMSPEQARGLHVDKRSDIFSFGGVVFEMLTGQKAFEGELVSDVMASVIKSEPSWALLPRSAGRLRKLLGRCLEKDPKKRLRDIGDARLELDEAEGAPLEVGGLVSRRDALMLAGVSSLVVAILTGLLVWRSAAPPEAGVEVTRFQFEIPSGPVSTELALSPDGRTLAFNTLPRGGISLRSLDSWETHALRGTETLRAAAPFFSSDGEWMGFLNLDDDNLYRIPIGGGTPVRVSPVPDSWTGSSWTENGTILLGGAGGVWEVDETGGSLRSLVSLPENEIAYAPSMLPGDTVVLFGHIRAGGESVVIRDLHSGETKTLVPNGQRPRYLPSGHLIYAMGSILMTAPFDASVLALAGAPVPVADGLRLAAGRRVSIGNLGVTAFAVSSAGTLAYLPDNVNTNEMRSLVLLDPGQAGDNGRKTIGDVRVFRDVRVSPDGRRLAAHYPGDENDIWIYDFDRGTTSRLTFLPGADETPVWSADGRFIAFAAQRGTRQLFRVPVDGSDPPEPLWASEHHMHVSDWSPDGRWVLFDHDLGPHADIWLLDMDGENEARPLLESRFNEHSERVSPDGNYLAYVSNESGREEVYVQRFPALGDKRQISNEGGAQPVWSRDGQKLFYRSLTHVMAVEVRLGPPFDVSAPERIAEDIFAGNPGGAHTYYDAMPDGKLVMLDDGGAEDRLYVNVVVNWAEELKRLAPTEN